MSITNNEVVLDVRNLHVQFRVDKKTYLSAVEDVSFKVRKKEILCIVGESGCGKSVTANTLMKLLPKQSSRIAEGEIILDGEDVVKMSDKEIRKVRGNKISMIFQEPMTSLNPVYRIGDQMIEMYRAHNKRMSRKEAWDKSVAMLEKVGIPAPEERMKSFPHQLSGGMRQRIMIAMALSARPSVLIADEPTTALDVTIQAQVLELMRDLQEEMETSVVLITHDMGVVAEMADTVMVMYAGEVVEQADVKTLFEAPKHPYTQGLLDSLTRADRDLEELPSIKGNVPSLDQMPSGCRFSNRCPYSCEKCVNEHPRLQQIKDGRLVRCHRCDAAEMEQ
ncbi:MAG: ABC transporter ATP-binding protein [Oscillospiraceae bacterium]|nr:ABC transporter ATP-binding protein [Oscillospiraceae bacterium]